MEREEVEGRVATLPTPSFQSLPRVSGGLPPPPRHTHHHTHTTSPLWAFKATSATRVTRTGFGRARPGARRNGRPRRTRRKRLKPNTRAGCASLGRGRARYEVKRGTCMMREWGVRLLVRGGRESATPLSLFPDHALSLSPAKDAHPRPGRSLSLPSPPPRTPLQFLRPSKPLLKLRLSA